MGTFSVEGAGYEIVARAAAAAAVLLLNPDEEEVLT